MSAPTGAPIAPTVTTNAPATAPRGGIVPFRLTVEQFEKMIDAGILGELDRVELLGGVLVAKMVKHSPHNFAVEGLAEALRRRLPDAWFVREEKPVVLGPHWRPEPDVAVVRGPRDLYRTRDPHIGDIAMIAEVVDSSHAADRGAKWRRYAACGIASYWIVNLPGGAVEVYTDPSGKGRSADYRGMKTYGPGDEIPVVLDGHEVGRVNARDVLP